MKKLRSSIGVIDRIYQNCSITDQKYINMLALLIPVSAIMAGGAFYYFVLFFSESELLSVVVGAICFFLAFWQGQSLLNSESQGQIYGRVAASLLIALFITIPFKTTQMYDSIVEKIRQEVEGQNSDVLLQMNATIEGIEQEGVRLNEEMMEASRNRQIDPQPFYDTRRALNDFNKTKQKRIDSVREAHNGKIAKAEITKFDVIGYYAKSMFSTENPSELFINLALIVFLLFIEASPAIIRLALDNGSYMEERDHYFTLKKIVKDNVRGLEKKIMHNDKDIVNDVFKMEIVKEKSKQVDTGFNDPKKLVQLAQMSNMMGNERTNGEPGKGKASQNGQAKNGEEFEDMPHEFFN
jgi:hypothetical protein